MSKSAKVAANVAIPSKPVKQPRISVNKLAEYLEANPSRRKQIVIDAKYPKAFVTTRYKDVRQTINEYFIGEFDEKIVIALLDALDDKKPTTDFQESDLKSSIEALAALLECDFSIFDGITISEIDQANQLIKIKGVDISVNPDLIIKKSSGGFNYVGAIKFHLSKSNILTPESQKIVSILLFKYVEAYIAQPNESPSIKLCLSHDVFGGRIEGCTPNFTMRMRRIEDACEEIALWWDKV